MICSHLQLPIPAQEAQAHSQRVSNHIINLIKQSHGKIPFSTYMEQALYAPGLGYYAAGASKFGRDGDFVTAPELTPLFGQCITHAITPFFQQYADGIFLELGAGSGKFAASLLSSCPFIQHYWILEVSADLRERQEETLKTLCPKMLYKVKWLGQLPAQPIRGIIFANEVMDALPASRFCWKDQAVYEYYVKYENEKFCWELGKPSNAFIQDFVTSLILPDNYSSEYRLLLKPWIHSLSDCLAHGAILLFDYGFPRREYYHPDRQDGTLMCHYRHYAHDNPFLWPGLQDITAHVDFTAVAEAAVTAELAVAGYTTQAAFLLENNLLNLAKSQTDNNHIKTLTLPSEMGELFKAILLTKDWDHSLSGFTLQDHRFRL